MDCLSFDMLLIRREFRQPVVCWLSSPIRLFRKHESLWLRCIWRQILLLCAIILRSFAHHLSFVRQVYSRACLLRFGCQVNHLRRHIVTPVSLLAHDCVIVEGERFVVVAQLDLDLGQFSLSRQICLTTLSC